MKPLVSILIPVYNRAELVIRAINSAINQTYPNIEIIVVDNKSTDQTYEEIKKISKSSPKIKVFQNEINVGPVRNWIKCLEKSSGSFIKILYSDDWMDKNFISEGVALLEKNDDIAFAYSKTIIYKKNSQKVYYNHKNSLIKSEDYIARSILTYSIPFRSSEPVSPSCALFRREDVVENLMSNIDNELGLDFNQYGAGIDLLLLILTANNYPYIGYLINTVSHFDSPEDSITIANRKKIRIYYFYAKLFFITEQYNNRLAKKFHAELKISSMFNKDIPKELINTDYLNIFFIIKALILIPLDFIYRKIR